MKRFFKVQMAVEGWGLLVNEGTAEEPRFRVLLKGSERWMDRLAAQMNSLPSDSFADGGRRSVRTTSDAR